MTDPIFVDTNIFVYSVDTTVAPKQLRARHWLQTLWHAGAGRVSIQASNEFYVVVTRNLKPGLPRAEARHLNGGSLRRVLVGRPDHRGGPGTTVSLDSVRR